MPSISRSRRLLAQSAALLRVCPQILMSSLRRTNWRARAITKSMPCIGTTSPVPTLLGRQEMLRTSTHANGGAMDPAETKNAEAPVRTTALPVVDNWKRISIVFGTLAIVLALVFWILFGKGVTTEDAQVDGY